MCLACEMENELWLAYQDYLAQQEKKAVEAVEQPKPAPKSETVVNFVCEEQPSE